MTVLSQQTFSLQLYSISAPSYNYELLGCSRPHVVVALALAARGSFVVWGEVSESGKQERIALSRRRYLALVRRLA